ncbi:MAG: BT_3928 family protein, partial [Ginsengibacter sp.]
MKILVNIARVIVGILFIFSGLIKANDPLGLSYKMQEFFDVWGRDESLNTFMNWLSTYALEFSFIIITLEIIVGVGILLGFWKKFFATLLLILTVFFTFLTGYAALSGKIATCGCFGDCIPLSSMQSFIKDIILTALILLIFFGQKYIYPLLTAAFNILILILATAMVLFFQWYVLRHMPVLDCLPFKPGNNLLELRKMPADAVPDKKDYKFVYEKDGKKQNFTVKDLPDSTWEFVSREDVIIEKGRNNEPP